MEKMGVKETKEIIVAANEITMLLLRHFRDGIQVSDFADIFAEISTSEEFKSALFQAYEGFSKIPSEMKDIDVNEAIELSSLQLSYIPKILETLKKT